MYAVMIHCESDDMNLDKVVGPFSSYSDAITWGVEFLERMKKEPEYADHNIDEDCLIHPDAEEPAFEVSVMSMNSEAAPTLGQHTWDELDGEKWS